MATVAGSPITLTGLALTSTAEAPLITAHAGDYNTGTFTPSAWSDSSTICGDIAYQVLDAGTGAVIDWVTVATSPSPLITASPPADTTAGDYSFTLKAYGAAFSDAEVVPETVPLHVKVSASCVIRSFTPPAAADLN